MDGTRVIAEDKRAGNLLLLFFGVIGAVIVVRVATGPMGSPAKAIVCVVAGLLTMACVVGWLRRRARPAGHMELSAESVTCWTGAGCYSRIARGPVRLNQVRVGGRASGWVLVAADHRLERGDAVGGPVDQVEDSINLFGYNPKVVAGDLIALGWDVQPRFGH